MAKLLLAQEKGVSIHLEVGEAITFSPKLNELMFIRVLGILLDNAIEELEALDHGQLELAFFKRGEETILMIQNTLRKNVEPLYQLKELGFSTKGTNRGFGLATVDELINQSAVLLLETKIHPGTFLQKITLLGGEESA